MFQPGEPRRLSWVRNENGSIASFAIKAGHDLGRSMFVARIHYQGGIIPGKIVLGFPTAHCPYDGKEICKSTYEVLTLPINSYSWVSTTGGNIHHDAIPGGYDPNGEIYFIGRVAHCGTVTCGKVHTRHGLCYISYGGKEYGYRSYELLIRNEYGKLLKI